MKKQTNKQGVQIDEYVEEPELKQASEYFESSIAGNDFVGYCSSKANYASQSGESYESKTWGFMNIMFGKYSTGFASSYYNIHHFITVVCRYQLILTFVTYSILRMCIISCIKKLVRSKC